MAALYCALILPAASMAVDPDAGLQTGADNAPLWQCQDHIENGVRVRSCRSVDPASGMQDQARPGAASGAVDANTGQAAGHSIDAQVADQGPAAASEANPTVANGNASGTAQNARKPVTAAEMTVDRDAVQDPTHDTATRQAVRAGAADSACADPALPASGAATESIIDPNAPVEASSQALSLRENIAEYEGDVEIVRGAARLKADRASYNRTSQIVELDGNVLADIPMAEVRGRHAEINLSDDSTFIAGADYQLHDRGARGSADSVSIDANRRVQIDNGSYTRCPENSKHWEVRASRIALDTQSGQGSARDATLRIYDTPVLYFPYARFPIGDQRQSGLLFPRIADTRAGVDLALPYYFNIAPNIDATLTPRFVHQAGYLTEAELRWLNRFDEWALGGAYIAEDDITGGDRWLLDIDERGSTDSGISSEIALTRTSDADYLRDLSAGSIGVNRNSHLEQRASISWHRLNWSLGANAQRFQTLDTSLQNDALPYETEPELWLQYNSLPRRGRLATNVELRAASFMHATLVEGERGYAQLDFALPMNWAGLRVTPSLGAQHLEYALDNPVAGSSDDKPAQTARFAALDVSAEWAKWQHAEGLARGGKKTITPRLRYLHRELGSASNAADELPLFDTKWLNSNEQLLFGNSRFAGYDVLEPAEQLSAGISHKSSDALGRMRSEFSLGQVFFFDRKVSNGASLASLADDSAALNARSAILADYRWQHNKALQTLATLQWESEANRVRRGSWQMRYRGSALPGGGQQLANLGYRYWRANPDDLLLQETIEQVDASAVTSLGRNWQVMARFQYDLTGKQSAESLAGLQYDDCCIQLRLVYRDGLIYAPIDDTPGSGTRAVRDHSFYIQIEFKGLAGAGRGLQNVLEESIFGYGDE